MFWKLVKRNLNRLLVKAALTFGLLLALSMALCLVSSSMLLRRSLRSALTEQLSMFLKNSQYPYITGMPRNQLGHSIAEKDVTNEEHAAMREAFPGGKLLFAFAREDGDRIFYVFSDGEVHFLRMDGSGNIESNVIPRAQRIEMLRNDFRFRIRREGARRLRLRLYAPDGKLELADPRDDGDSFAKYFISRKITLFDGSVIEATRSTREIGESLLQLFHLQAAIFIIIFVIALPCCWLLVRHLLAGISEVSEAALRISNNGDFDCRVSAKGGSTETTDLVDAFNTMNDNNRRLFNEVRSVTDDVAHDLKTPLTRLQSAAEVTLGDREAGESAEKLAAVVSEECGEMLELINSMLEITRTESGLSGMKPETVDLAEQLRRAHELFLPVAEDLGIDFRIELPDRPVCIRGDRVKLQRVFSNLIDNALKFNKRGGKVVLTMKHADPGVIITVADTGCGIAEKDLPHIFERLFRCDASRSLPGNGLGLTLARAIIRAHGGEILVDSTPGRGSTFTVRLPDQKGPVS